MKKYYIGLLVLAAIVVGLLGYTLYQGGLAKQDKVVLDRATEIADKLNNYVSTENKIPASLSAADIDDVPEAISYKKLSDEKYKFCVTYKSASRGYGVGPTEVLTAALMQQYAAGAYDYGDSYEPATLYVDSYGYTKGENCQTIKPYLSSSLDDTTNSQAQFCDPEGEFYEFYKDYCAGLDEDTTDLDTQEN